MLTFGILSSIFDYLTFGVLHLLRSSPDQFRTGWLVESVLSASLIVLVVRSRWPLLSQQARQVSAPGNAGCGGHDPGPAGANRGVEQGGGPSSTPLPHRLYFPSSSCQRSLAVVVSREAEAAVASALS